MPPSLTEADYAAAAGRLGCSVAAIKAVAKVESKGSGFLPSGEPRILFERHVFRHRYREAAGAEEAAGSGSARCSLDCSFLIRSKYSRIPGAYW